MIRALAILPLLTPSEAETKNTRFQPVNIKTGVLDKNSYSKISTTEANYFLSALLITISTELSRVPPSPNFFFLGGAQTETSIPSVPF